MNTAIISSLICQRKQKQPFIVTELKIIIPRRWATFSSCRARVKIKMNDRISIHSPLSISK